MFTFKNSPQPTQRHLHNCTRRKGSAASDQLHLDDHEQQQQQQQSSHVHTPQQHPRRPQFVFDSNTNSSVHSSSNSILSLSSIDSGSYSHLEKERDTLSLHNFFKTPETTKRERKNSTSSRAKNAISALSKRFSPPPPARSLSFSSISTTGPGPLLPLPDLTAAATTITTGSPSTPSPSPAMTPRRRSDTGTSMSLSGGGRSLSLPSPGSTSGKTTKTTDADKDHLRHHTVSTVPLPDPRAIIRSSCASSVSSSAASSTSSLSSSASSSSSAFFSPTTFYSSLFGNHQHQQHQHASSLVDHSSSSSSQPPVHPSSDIATSTHPVTTSATTPPLPITPGNKTLAMGMTRQSRSASCTPSFSLSGLSISRDSGLGGSSVSQTESLSTSPVDTCSGPFSPRGPTSSSSSSSSCSSGQTIQRSQSVSSASSTMVNAAYMQSLNTATATTLPPLPHFAPLPLAANLSADDFMTEGSPLNPLSIAVTNSRDIMGTGGMASVGPVYGPFHTSSSCTNDNGWHHQYQQQPPPVGRSSVHPTSPLSSSSASDSGFLGGSRRSSKDSCESVPGVTLDNLVNQLTVPDYLNPLEQIAKTKVFLMIYRKFLRPRELLDMLIERFEELGEFVDDDDEEAKNTRIRICAILMAWLKHHPNDLIHRQTRQQLARFLRDRVALFPCLNEIYVQLLPLSSIHHFNNWRWPLNDSHSDSRNSSISGPTAMMSTVLDEDTDSGYHDTLAFATEADMDEDREWGLFDEDDGGIPEINKPTTNQMSFDSLGASAPQVYASTSISSTPTSVMTSTSSPLRLQPRSSLQPLPRDRRSSTGSLAHTSPCAMETFVSNRRGSASSVASGPAAVSSSSSTSTAPPTAFSEGDATPHQLQPMAQIPFITKRGSSQAYRQRSIVSQSSAISQGSAHTTSSATLIFRETVEEAPVHPLQHGSSTGSNWSVVSAIHHQPPPIDYLSMNTPFMDIKDGAIAAQLTSVEFLLFKKLRPRDMLRQVWKTKKGSAAFQACISHFNFISSWVGTMILSPAKVKSRAKMMEKFINIAKLLRDMGNFNTTMAIIGAMNTSSIHRLVQTRELLQGKEIWTTFKELEHLMSSERSFFEYRAALKVQPLPCIPYLGVHLGDLLSISEGNRDFRQDGTIHWQKFCLLTEVISTVMQFQSKPYEIQPDPFISRVITDTHVLDDEELYTKSIGTEPSKLHHSRSLSKFNFF